MSFYRDEALSEEVRMEEDMSGFVDDRGGDSSFRVPGFSFGKTGGQHDSLGAARPEFREAENPFRKSVVFRGDAELFFEEPFDAGPVPVFPDKILLFRGGSIRNLR